MGHHEYRPLADMLVEMAERYGKPIMLSETGAEGTGKPSWLHYVCNEVRDAMGRGADIRGICWYPITAYPGWDNSRHAETGLLSTVVADGSRHVDERLLAEFEAPARAVRGVRSAAEAQRRDVRGRARSAGRPAARPTACRPRASRRAIRCGPSAGSGGC